MKKAKTPLLAFLQKAYQIAAASTKKGAPPADELLDQAKERAWTRRKFLEKSGKAAVLTGMGGWLAGCNKEGALLSNLGGDELTGSAKKKGKNEAKIAIVGAGIAGLHALHTLKQGGVNNVTLYEGSERVGGRIMTASNVMAPGLKTEFGGEFIDTSHDDMLNLASYFGLTLLDTQASSEQSLIKDAYFFNGQHYTLAQVIAEFEVIAPQMESDIAQLSNNITYWNHSAADVFFDNQSISTYLTSIGCSGWLKELLEVAYETEYGLSPTVQSCINLLFLISTDTSGGTFDIFGDSDERYKIAGGNQQIVDLLAGLYPSHIETGRALTAIGKQGDGYLLHLSGYGQPKKFDYVLLTLPFTILRNIDIQFTLPTWKQNAIDNLGYGTNAKLMLGFTDRHWRGLGYTGYLFTDNGVQTGWDNSQMQAGNTGPGGFTVYVGGQTGIDIGSGTAQSQASNYLPLLDQMFPGMQAKYNGNAARFHWPSYPWSLCSYACYTTGQFTTVSGAERKTVDRLYFAGEHCSWNFQGYMNGAAHTGREAAEEILDDLS